MRIFQSSTINNKNKYIKDYRHILLNPLFYSIITYFKYKLSVVSNFNGSESKKTIFMMKEYLRNISD